MKFLLPTLAFFLTCIISLELISFVYVVSSDELPQVEWNEPMDAEEESEHSPKDKIERHHDMRMDVKVLISDIALRSIHASSKCYALCHLEISTPPPEMI